MRIALVTREYPPETAWGGIGSFYHSFATALAKADHAVEVFCQGLSDSGSSMMGGVLVHRVRAWKDGTGPGVGEPLAGNDDIGVFAFGLASAMLDAVARRHASAPFDIIEGHEHLGINALINNARLAGARTVTRYHTAYESLVKRRLVDWTPSATVRALERQAIHSADLRIATSDFIAGVTEADFDAPPAEALIFNLIDEPSAGPVAPPAEREDVILFVGRLVLNHKRPDLAVQAFAALAERFPTWRLEVAGADMDMPQGGTVWQHCASLLPDALKPRVRYHGTLPHAEVQALFGRAKILLAPSDFESFGLVAIEAMQAGCVPVVADETALIDWVADAQLIFARGRLGNLIERVEALLADPALIEAKSAACRSRALAAFTPSALLAQNIAAFERARAGAAPHRHVIDAVPAATSDDPLISVVIPSFNQGPFIGETIRSILDQDYPHIEVIVMDGGSTDATIEVLKGFPQITWISERDRGQTHAINKGMLLARGDIRAYLNSDDVYRPGAFRAIADIFRREPETQILVGNCDYIDEHSQVIGHLKAKFTGLQNLVRYGGWERFHCIPQQATFWRASLMSEVGLFDISRHMVMDYDYWMRAAQHADFRTVDQTLAAFRLMAGTKTVSRTDEMYDEEYEAFLRYRHVLPLPLRIRASLEARHGYADKLLMFAQHQILTLRLRRKPAGSLMRIAGLWPPYLLSARYILCVLHLTLTLVGSQDMAGQIHRRELARLERWKSGWSAWFQGKVGSAG